jgi:hypothetical protein
MKKLFLSILLIVLYSQISFSQAAGSEKNPAGLWQFTAPYAPEGYNIGIMTIDLIDKEYSIRMAFKGMDYYYPAEEVEFRNDSLLFWVFIDGISVDIFLKMENETKMEGEASTPDAMIPITLQRNEEKEKEK